MYKRKQVLLGSRIVETAEQTLSLEALWTCSQLTESPLSVHQASIAFIWNAPKEYVALAPNHRFLIRQQRAYGSARI